MHTHTTAPSQEIRPYETKTIARASFFGASVANYTSFVRVRMNHKGNPSVVLPVEVEVSDHSGLFLSRELLDFGVVKGGGVCVVCVGVLTVLKDIYGENLFFLRF